jgi:hypothetical protein
MGRLTGRRPHPRLGFSWVAASAQLSHFKADCFWTSSISWCSAAQAPPERGHRVFLYLCRRICLNRTGLAEMD